MTDAEKTPLKPLMDRDDLRQILTRMPSVPGVYLMKDAQGTILYIGKAVHLRNRVRSYFNPAGDERPRVQVFRKKVCEIETVVTDSEKAALLLENTLIKKHRPRYNVALKDDKSFLGIRLSVQDAVPRLTAVRRPKKDGAAYFGPFHSAFALRQVIHLIQKVFGVRVCSDTFFRNRTRPCVEHQIGRCLAPCVAGHVTDAEYAKSVEETIRFLRGHAEEVLRTLKERMQEASENDRFEAAIKIRDQIAAIETTLQDPVVSSHRRDDDQDFIGYCRQDGETTVYVLMVRRGQVVGGQGFPLGKPLGSDEEILTSFLLQRYEGPERAYLRPREIALPLTFDNTSILEDALKTRLVFPQRSERKKLLEMAQQNARVAFEKAREKEGEVERTLSELAFKLHMEKSPERIECVDISNFQGRDAVGSLVVFVAGVPDKNEYRRYRIKTVTGSNDYEMIAEVLRRRFSHEGPRPDLLIVDGGKGQLAMAKKVLEEMEIGGFTVAGLAKARTLAKEKGSTEERIFLPGRSNPVTFRRGSGALHLLERIRNEAHRFAITYHRKLRKKHTLQSILDEIPGIGSARRIKLFEIFGSIEGIRRATLEDLCEQGGLPEPLAKAVMEKLSAN